MREYDFIVVGTGISGLSFALKAAASGKVAILTKRRPEISNTAWAQGGTRRADGGGVVRQGGTAFSTSIPAACAG